MESHEIYNIIEEKNESDNQRQTENKNELKSKSENFLLNNKRKRENNLTVYNNEVMLIKLIIMKIKEI